MKIKVLKISLFIITIFFTLSLRLVSIDKVPPGITTDAASIGYDAYSLSLTLKDQYGKTWPIFLRDFGSFQSPLYGYLTIIPIKIFGPEIWVINLVSVLSGTVLSGVTFWLIYSLLEKNKFVIASLGMFAVAISPWSVLFSRSVTESNLAVTFLALGLTFLMLSLKQIKLLILAAIFLAISTYAYHAERLISFLLVFTLLFTFKKYFLKHKFWISIFLIVFIVIQIPQLLLSFSPGSTRRMAQVNYWSPRPSAWEKFNFIGSEFATHYLAYFSVRNLFTDPDPQQARSIPNLSVFYPWMVIPFFLGIKYLVDNRKNNLVKLIIVSAIIMPIPAALTKEPFYTARVISLLWVITIIISLGLGSLLSYINKPFIRMATLIVIFSISLFQLYLHYFIFLPNERSDNYSYPYIKLTEEIRKYPDKHFVIDTGRESQSYIIFALYWKYNPKFLQKQTQFDVKEDYYSDTSFTGERIIDNLEIRPIYWKKDIYIDQVLVGDTLAISGEQANEHKLKLLFEIKNLNNKVMLRGFQTNPTIRNSP